jgi:integrase/recombinase XerD
MKRYLPEAFARAAEGVIAERSHHTRVAYTRDLRHWLAYCEDHELHPATAQVRDARAYSDSLEGRPATRRRRVAALSSIYEKLSRADEPVTSRNPFHPRALEWPKVANAGSTPLVSDADVDTMLTNARRDRNRQRGLRDAALLGVLYDTGMRRESAATARRADFDAKRRLLKVIGKGDKEARVTLSPRTVDALHAWLQIAPRSTYLFCAQDGAQLHPASVYYVVRERGRRAGVGRVTPHQFRVTFITTALDAAIPLHEVQAAVGHADAKTTLRYDRAQRGEAVFDQLAARRGRK